MSNGKNLSTGSVISNADDEIVEITLDVWHDTVAVHSIKTVCGADVDDQKKSSLNASSKFSRISQELKRLTSFSKKLQLGKFDRTKSAAAHGLKGLRFISKTGRGAGWPAVEERFDDLTSNTNGLLSRAQFGECIGMNKDSKEFSLELFDALGRRRYFSGGLIDKSQLKEYWDQISDHNFDSRLQTFFDMIDQDKDGRIIEEDVKKIINLSASANKLYTIQKEANEYAPLIMEELDPDNLGYIMIEKLKMLLLQAPTHSVSQMISQMLDYPF